MSSLTQTETRGNTAGPYLPFIMLIGLYVSQSIVGSVVQSSLPTILRDQGYSLSQIGLMSILTLPWALKIFWAPLVDRYGTVTVWILACQLTLAGLFAIAAFLDTATAAIMIAGLLIVLVIAAATQDIATDTLAVQTTSSGNREIASGASSIGAYLGFMIGGGAWLWVYATYGWRLAMITIAVTMIVLTLSTMLSKTNPKQPTAASGASLLHAIKSPLIGRGIVFLILWHGAVRLGMSLGGAMLVDAGLDLQQIALLRGFGGMIVGLIGSICAMALVRRYGLRSALLVTAILLISCFLAHAAWYWVGTYPTSLLIAANLALSAAIGVSFVTVYAVLMELCSPDQIATDFSVLQSVDILLLVLAGILSGILAQYLGYFTLFLVAIALMCAALPYARHLALQISNMSGPQQ